MSEWRCEVVLADGRRDWRRVIAASADDAAAQLIADGITPLQLRTGALGFVERLQQPVMASGGLSSADQALVLGQLATLLKAGMPLDRSIDLLADQLPRARQRDWLRESLVALRGGERPSAALASRAMLPPWVVGVIAAADRSARLDKALAELAEEIGAAARSRAALITALTYPAAIVAATLVALIVILTLVVPQFEPILAANASELPWLTQAVLGLSAIVRSGGLTLLVMALAGAAILWAGWHAKWFERAGRGAGRARRLLTLRDRFLAARFARLLAALLGNGIALVPALGMVGPAMGSRRWAAMAADAAQAIREGAALTTALRGSTLVPPTLIRLIEVGEHSGALAVTLSEAGRIIEAGARARLERLISLANPIAIILLGAIVAMLVAGVLLGLFAVGDFAA